MSALRALRALRSTAHLASRAPRLLPAPTLTRPFSLSSLLRDPPRPTLFTHEFSLADRVAIVSGANRGIGLEAALALLEGGARAVYCLDRPTTPSSEFVQVGEYVGKMDVGLGGERRKGGRLEYVSVDVTDKEAVVREVGKVGDREGRVDVCVAAAGILRNHVSCIEYPEEEFKEVMDVNVNGVLYTAQAAGLQMARFNKPGSIILVASMSGSLTNMHHHWVSYNTSKGAVIQMARSMACELGARGIRVNSLSPGYIYTSLTKQYLDKHPGLQDKWSAQNPLGRIGRPDELRGVVAWLASDASTYCTGSDIMVTGGHHSW
ncbi:NAD P-binding protein [Gloeophyllum trabeum ATCC 11539]|uniref:NAD P-binding protein n=1 Tax=Gloeophyllum trabeum (strain ATCC 11539 / FP-39264 / Madison 617) TaxID=670483 RepID=S7QE05_GLOTA|nr:NAD P-binding protein [Gloeophyllum trabeum ATCC 11539]EPQ57647.1 NAD P-binding protein [Gloeophyllum trabeum ATCC 11539]